MKRIINYRQLAEGIKNKEGKKIRNNTIFRSGMISFADEEDIFNLVSSGIQYIYNFTSDEEFKRFVPLSSEIFTTKHFNILPEAGQFDNKQLVNVTKDYINKMMLYMYSELFAVTEGFSPVIEEVVRQDSLPFLYHCTAGKDRTGIFSIIMMMILDFDLKEIKEEYLKIDGKSMLILKNQMLQGFGVSEELGKAFDDMFLAAPEFFDAYIASIQKNYCTFDKYLEEKVGVTKEVKEFLKQRYLCI